MRKHKERDAYIKNRVLIHCSILTLLFFLNCFVGEMAYIIYPFVFLLILFDNRRAGFSYLIFCIPYAALTIYMGTILYGACIVLYIVKFYIMLYAKDHSKPNYIMLALMALFLIYCLLPIGNYNYQKLIKTAVFFVLFAVIGMIIKKPDIINLHKNTRIFALSLIISCVFGFTYWISPYLQATQSLFIMSNGHSRYQALLMQPNVLAMCCEVILAFLTYYMVSGQTKKRDIIMFVVVAFIGVMTLSKTYLLILLFILAVLFIWRMCKRPLKTLVYTGIIGSIICVALLSNIPFTVSFMQRFGSGFSKLTNFRDFMNMVSTGRYELWLSYLVYIALNPLALIFGDGLGAVRRAFSSPHNAYISAVYELGIVGLFLLGLVIAAMIWEFKKNKTTKVSKAFWIPLVVFGLLCMVEDVIFFIY